MELNQINFNDVDYSEFQEIEEVITPGWGTVFCCTE